MPDTDQPIDTTVAGEPRIEMHLEWQMTPLTEPRWDIEACYITQIQGDPCIYSKHIPDLDLDGWTELAVTTLPIAAHVETIHENGVDAVHFGVVHGFPLSDPAYAEDGASFHSEFHFATPNFLREGPPEIVTFFDTDAHGLGYAHSLNTAAAVGLQYRVLLSTTPTTAGHLDFTLASTCPPPGRGHHRVALRHGRRRSERRHLVTNRYVTRPRWSAGALAPSRPGGGPRPRRGGSPAPRTTRRRRRSRCATRRRR